MRPQGKEKIILDKTALLEAYFYLDKLYHKTMDSDLEIVYSNLRKATGYDYDRTLRKVENNKHDRKK
jgi:hypothetical protein